MFNFEINFSFAWLLLLIVPAVVLTLLPYFKLSKRFRKNRNRISSVVLHLTALILCIFVLSGMTFSYEVHNSENELLLVVDASFSTSEEKQAKDEFVRSVIEMTNPDVYSLGIVTFGLQPVCAVPLTDDLRNAYSLYESSAKPDTTATDISAALLFARDMLTHPESAKIVLLSDGVETDGSAASVVRSITSSGTRIDSVLCGSLTGKDEVQAISVQFPDSNILKGEQFDLTLSVASSRKGDTPVTVTLFDNDDECRSLSFSLKEGVSDIVIPHVLTEEGLHTLRFKVSPDLDTISENNELYSYMYLNVFDKVLVVESSEGSSDKIRELLVDFDVTAICPDDAHFPKTLDELLQYDEIILNNIANSDLPDGWDELLNRYVYDAGGGLFTVGGSEGGDVSAAHAYNREDMAGTLLQRMLPVEAIDYTPPLGMMIVIDVSGSMSTGTGVGTVQKIDAAKNAAVSMVRDYTCLNERDYCGVLTLSDDYTEDASLLPMTRQDEIIEAIYGISSGGGTLFTPAVNHAGMALRAMYTSGRIEKMHVVIITDGAAADFEKYIDRVEHFNNLGVTYSFIAIDASGASMEQLEEAARLGGGKAYNSGAADLTGVLKDDIRIPEIKEVEYREFVPEINPDSYYASIISQEEMPSLYGFYGTRKKSGAELVLSGEYKVPVYAQWKYGNGTVGSFMCDLDGTWSADFLDAGGKGRELLLGVVNKLFPTTDIRPKNLDVVLREENYTTQISIYPVTDLKEGESVEVSLENLSNPNASAKLTVPVAEEKFSRASLVAVEAGVYRITVQKKDAGNNPDGSPCVVYKTFSYSAEYDVLNDPTDGSELMTAIAASGNGSSELLSEKDAVTVFQGFKETLKRSFDPRFLFMITALVLFLLDIAARKFKWKWPHELVRERRERERAKEPETRNEARMK